MKAVVEFIHNNWKIVSILLLIAFAAWAFFLMQGKTKAGVEDAASSADTYNESKYTEYDGAIVTGSEVISCINNWRGKNVAVVVDGVCFNYSVSGDYNTLTECTDSTHNAGVCSRRGAGATYISGSAQYLGAVHRSTDGTNEITCVEFTLQR